MSDLRYVDMRPGDLLLWHKDPYCSHGSACICGAVDLVVTVPQFNGSEWIVYVATEKGVVTQIDITVDEGSSSREHFGLIRVQGC